MYFYHVLSEMPGSFEREVALATVVGPLSSVFALVYPQMRSTGARIVALSAIERLFS